MKKEKNALKVAAIATGAAVIGAFGTNEAKASLLEFENLGTGGELRSTLIGAEALNPIVSNVGIELECGEGKCGEGKCGGDKKAAKADKKADAKAAKPAAKAAPAAKSGEMKAAKAADGKEKKAEKAAKPDKAAESPE